MDCYTEALLEHDGTRVSQQEYRQALIAAGRRLDRHGWVPGGGGNFSARLAPGQFLLTVSGRHKGQLSEDDFLLVDAGGRSLEAGRTPSAETLLHCERYAALPAIGCVLHGHSPAATVLGRRHAENWLELKGYEMLKGLGGVQSHEATVALPLFDNDQDIERLAAQIRARHAARPIEHGYIIRGHGVYAWGTTIEQALWRYESLEFLLQCQLMELQIR